MLVRIREVNEKPMTPGAQLPGGVIVPGQVMELPERYLDECQHLLDKGILEEVEDDGRTN